MLKKCIEGNLSEDNQKFELNEVLKSENQAGQHMNK